MREILKSFLMYNLKDNQTVVLHYDNTKKLIKFDIDPLAAASSGELTSLVYGCDEKNLSGLVLGFYGSRWNDAGIVYQAYAFKPSRK